VAGRRTRRGVLAGRGSVIRAITRRGRLRCSGTGHAVPGFPDLLRRAPRPMRRTRAADLPRQGWRRGSRLPRPRHPGTGRSPSAAHARGTTRSDSTSHSRHAAHSADLGTEPRARSSRLTRTTARRPSELTPHTRRRTLLISLLEARAARTPTRTPTAPCSPPSGNVRLRTHRRLTCTDAHERTSANAFPVPDTEEVTGSIPVSPTSKAPGHRPGAFALAAEASMRSLGWPLVRGPQCPQRRPPGDCQLIRFQRRDAIELGGPSDDTARARRRHPAGTVSQGCRRSGEWHGAL
jgi:hypothetical protein